MIGGINEATNIAIFVDQNADKIMVLMQAGFFNMQSGSVTAHFDAQGDIRKIERHNIFNVS